MKEADLKNMDWVEDSKEKNRNVVTHAYISLNFLSQLPFQKSKNLPGN